MVRGGRHKHREPRSHWVIHEEKMCRINRPANRPTRFCEREVVKLTPNMSGIRGQWGERGRGPMTTSARTHGCSIPPERPSWGESGFPAWHGPGWGRGIEEKEHSGGQDPRPTKKRKTVKGNPLGKRINLPGGIHRADLRREPPSSKPKKESEFRGN